MVESCCLQVLVALLRHLSPHYACVVRVVLCLGGVSIFEEHILYVSIHGYAAGSIGVLVIIIPCKVYSCELSPFLFGCDIVVLIQDLEEM